MTSATAAAPPKSAATRTGCAFRAARSASEMLTASTGCVPVGVIPPLGVRIASRCGSSSSARCHRSAAFFSRHRITSWFSDWGTAARCAVVGSGAWVTCAPSTAWALVPVNGGRPQSISYAIAPRA